MRRLKSVIGTEHPIVAKVKEITSSEKWAPHSTAMRDIATMSRTSENYNLIMDTLWNRLDEPPEKWRKVYKALILLEYLALRAEDKIIKDIRERSYKLKELANSFEYVEPVRGENEGRNVRVKAQKLVDLVFDEDRVKDERAKAISSMGKFDSASVSPAPSTVSSSATGFGSDSIVIPSARKTEDEKGLPPPVEFNPTMEGGSLQAEGATAKEENNIEGFDGSFFGESSSNTGTNGFGFKDNGFDNAFADGNDDGFIDSGNPTPGSSTKRGVHVEIKNDGARQLTPSLALPKPPAREPSQPTSTSGEGGGLDSLFQVNEQPPAPAVNATSAPSQPPSELEKQKSMNLISNNAFDGPDAFDGSGAFGGSSAFGSASTFDEPNAFGGSIAPAPNQGTATNQPPVQDTLDPFSSMPAMQLENSSFSHLMVVNDEKPKTMELSSEDKKLHEKFGFSEVQASLVSLDLAADSTGNVKQKNPQASRGKSMGRGSGLGMRDATTNSVSTPPPAAGAPNYQKNPYPQGAPQTQAPPAAAGDPRYNPFGASQPPPSNTAGNGSLFF